MADTTNTEQPTIIIFNDFDQAYVNNVNLIIAPVLMGALADMFLQGILVVQTTNYFAFHNTDGRQHRFKWLVILLGILCLLKSVQNMVIVWNMVVATYANPATSYATIVGTWEFRTTGLSTAIIATGVQGFFACRYWKLTKRWYICVVMLLGMIVSLVAAAIIPVYVTSADIVSVSKWSLVHFVAAIIVDGLITVGTIRYLHHHKMGVQSTANLIDHLVRMTWQSALPPAIFVSINAVLTETHKSDLLQIALNTVLPKLYAISLMYTLNMGNEMRESQASIGTSTSVQFTLSIKPTSTPNTDSLDRNAQTSIIVIEAGNGTRDESRGVKFLGTHTLDLNGRLDVAGRRVDGETHMGTNARGGTGNTIEMNSFQGDDDHKDRRNSEGDSDVWIRDQKHHSS